MKKHIPKKKKKGQIWTCFCVKGLYTRGYGMREVGAHVGDGGTRSTKLKKKTRQRE